MLLITDLPSVMRTEGWAVAARCMERWFRLGPHEMSADEKTGRVAMDRLAGPVLATDVLTMAWATGFERVRKVADELAGKWNTPKGQVELLVKLRAWQPGRPPCQVAGGTWAFGDFAQPVATVDSSFQVNYLSVGAMTDPLDDFYGAVGRGTLKVAVSGTVTNGADGRPASMAVNSVGIYLRDTYDFVGDQFLGLWSETGVNRNRLDEAVASKISMYNPVAIDKAEYDRAVAADREALSRPVVSPMGGGMMPPAVSESQLADIEKRQWHSVSNADFRRYRTASGKGGDYVNVSDVRVTRLPQPVTVTF